MDLDERNRGSSLPPLQRFVNTVKTLSNDLIKLDSDLRILADDSVRDPDPRRAQQALNKVRLTADDIGDAPSKLTAAMDPQLAHWLVYPLIDYGDASVLPALSTQPLESMVRDYRDARKLAETKKGYDDLLATINTRATVLAEQAERRRLAFLANLRERPVA